jgi:hypothetical protein
MLSTTDLLLIIAIVFIGVVMTKKQEIIIMKDSDGPVTQEINVSGGGDDRYKRAPRPQRFWQAEPEIPIRGALDPIPTRGAPESYQQMGVVLGSDGKPLPLYGRRVAPRSDRFNYYTRTDTYNPVALPVIFKNKNCQDNLGCHQVFNGDSIQISPTGEEVKVTLYGFDGPRYNPNVA